MNEPKPEVPREPDSREPSWMRFAAAGVATAILAVLAIIVISLVSHSGR